MNDLSSEVLLWRQLQHPNILQFLGVNDEDFVPSFAIVTPWMENGSLSSFLDRRPFYSISRKLGLARQVVEGLRYLHRHSPPIVHCDIKAGNILVSNDETCCIGDFGLSVVERSSPFSDFTDSFEVRGSLRWLAPELITPGVSDADNDLGNACGRITRDIYALGCTILEIITGNAPFYEQKSDMKIMIDVLNGVRPAHPKRCPDSIWELLEMCWDEDMELRPAADEVLALLDEWLGENEEDDGKELIEALDLVDVDLELEEEEERSPAPERARPDSPLLGVPLDDDVQEEEVPQVTETLQNFFQSLLVRVRTTPHTIPSPSTSPTLDSVSSEDSETGSLSEASSLSPATPTSGELVVSTSFEGTPWIETIPAHWEQSKSDSELLLTPYKEDFGREERHGQSEPLFPSRLPAESIWNDMELRGAWKWFRERRGRRRKGS
ncbi:hypothetical protein VNI00_007320 [Paramarasmius palmivorus]|uniref:Protein kinase domain-containing protein n=1 Tax=Paramarasmius palmivorus TaxID=297713 RepID=A0AAW0D2R6_9AGAR